MRPPFSVITELTLVAAHLTGRMRQNEWDPAGNMTSRLRYSKHTPEHRIGDRFGRREKWQVCALHRRRYVRSFA
jgi:hypothetical protein